MDVEARVLQFFLERGLRAASVPEQLATRYLEEQLLDSMGVVTMIAEFEEEFDMTFQSDDFEADAFGTIAGLIEAIERARARAGSSAELA